MTRWNSTSSQAMRRRGFTLLELMVAIIVLMVGVVAAMRIFPRGFEIFRTSEQSAIARTEINRRISELEEHPENLPEAILPVDYDSNNDGVIDVGSGSSATPDNFRWSDTNAVQYGGGDQSEYRRYLLTLPDGSNEVWPLWQPRSMRVLRRVVGERCVIPSELSQTALTTVTSVGAEAGGETIVGVEDAAQLQTGASVRVDNVDPNAVDFNASVKAITGTLVTLITNGGVIKSGATLYSSFSFAKGYLVQFGPIQGNQGVSIYDLRYRHISKEELQDLLGKMDSLPDKLFYTVDYATGQLFFLPDAIARKVRVVYYKKAVNGDLTRTETSIDLAATTVAADFTKLVQPTATLVGVVPGSEVLNRQYQLFAGITAKDDPSSEEFTELTQDEQDAARLSFPQKFSRMPSGSYYIEKMTASDSRGKVLLGKIYFSPQDAGRTVKIDYTVADWNILHEDVTVDQQGYFQLSLVPKTRNNPNRPREPHTWGLYEPMRDGKPAVVMALVNMTTGEVSEVEVDDAGSPTTFTFSDCILTQDKHNRLRWRIEQASDQDAGKALKGQTLRVFYRATHDWSMQFFRPPAVFWYQKPLDDANVLIPFADLKNPKNLTPFTLDWLSFSWGEVDGDGDPNTKTDKTGWVAVSGYYEGQSVAVDYQYHEDNNAPNPLKRVSGELHAVPSPVKGKTISVFKLRYLPADGTTVTVRGVSVTLRVFWVQPRKGDVTTLMPPPADDITKSGDVTKSFKERWSSKQAIMILPTVGE